VRIAAALAVLVLAFTAHAQPGSPAGLPVEHIASSRLALVINIESAESIAVGDYYRQARQIPERNLIRVRLPGKPRVLSAAQFAQLREQILVQLDPSIDIIALAWTAPYAVECNSLTAALTLGFDPALCANTCQAGKPSALYDSPSQHPYRDLGLRPAMLLPADPVLLGVELIDRGVRSDGSLPQGTAYLLTTSDPLRNSRAAQFPANGLMGDAPLLVLNLRGDSLANRRDVMFYFTGIAHVAQLDTLHFLPGAIADHLTSAGGDLLGDTQMSSLRWLQAGATASYGTVSEPCNYWQKFPNVAVLLRHYLAGEPAVLAYWKSVAWPAQGVFIGEPLAAPYQQ